MGTTALGLGCAAARAHARLSQEDFQGTKVRKGGLQQIHADKSREPKPVRTMIVSQQKADQNESPGESADDHFHWYSFARRRPLFQFNCVVHSFSSPEWSRDLAESYKEKAARGGCTRQILPIILGYLGYLRYLGSFFANNWLMRGADHKGWDMAGNLTLLVGGRWG